MRTTKTKFVCPECKAQLVMTTANFKPHCPECGFECRRTLINKMRVERRFSRKEATVDSKWAENDPWRQVQWRQG